MQIQTVEIRGERYVILSERDYLAMKEKAAPASPSDSRPARFSEIKPLQVGGVPASEVLIQDRR